jgi:signal transduction histidine kinase
MGEEPASTGGGRRLAWLDTEKALELCAHDLNNMAHAALSYIDLANDPKVDGAARAKFLGNAHDIVRRASLFSPNLLAMVRARDAPMANEASRALAVEFEAAIAKRRERFPEAAVPMERTGDAWQVAVHGGGQVWLALYHLVDNALRYPRPGQAPRVRVDATREGDAVRVTVEDEGRGFSAGQEAYASLRFSEPGRVSGAGLGLATVRLVAEGAGGSMEIGNRDNPRGARVVVRLPIAP